MSRIPQWLETYDKCVLFISKHFCYVLGCIINVDIYRFRNSSRNSVPVRNVEKPSIKTETNIREEYICNIPSPFENGDPDLIRLLTDEDEDDDEDMGTPKFEGSAKYGRRSIADLMKPPTLGLHEFSLHLENISNSNSIFDSILCTERKVSAKYGRRSQSNQASRASSIMSTDMNEIAELAVKTRSEGNIKEIELLNALMKCDVAEENDERKNSARYGRRAFRNSSSTRVEDISTNSFAPDQKFSVIQSKSKMTKLPERKKSIIEEININKLLIFLRDNVVGTVILLTALVWIPASCLISYFDKKRLRKEERLKEWTKREDIMYFPAANDTYGNSSYPKKIIHARVGSRRTHNTVSVSSSTN
jgi:hypothetical protein